MANQASAVDVQQVQMTRTQFRPQKNLSLSKTESIVRLKPMKNAQNKKQWIKPQMKEVRISMESTAYSPEAYR